MPGETERLASEMNLQLLVFCNTDWSHQESLSGLGAAGTTAGTIKTGRGPQLQGEFLSNISTYQSWTNRGAAQSMSTFPSIPCTHFYFRNEVGHHSRPLDFDSGSQTWFEMSRSERLLRNFSWMFTKAWRKKKLISPSILTIFWKLIFDPWCFILSSSYLVKANYI